MYKREIEIINSNSFLLFGARGTGKSTLLEDTFKAKKVFWINLLLPEEEDSYLFNPKALSEQLDAMDDLPEWVVIDEIQKVPKLLDIIHYEIETREAAKARKLKFALTGSSARKLKTGSANLLAGRAFTNNLYPLTFIELAKDFNLINVLSFGSLPFVINSKNELEKKSFLTTYINTYLKEEVIQEQLIRNVKPFRKFLPIASQVSGTILNFNNIAKDLGVDWSTVKNYFDILEDTLLGFQLPAYGKSLRKQQLKSPKFYLFDLGIKRALDRSLNLELTTSQMIGPLFEHFIICEMHRLNDYYRKDFVFSYLHTQGGLEVDLIIERPGKADIFIEIKSSENISERKLNNIQRLAAEFPEYEFICLSREKHARKIKNITIFPWKKGIEYLGLTN